MDTLAIKDVFGGNMLGSRLEPKDGFPGPAKIKVFISYSRKDAEAFAEEVAGGLEFQGGFDVSLDRHSIVEGEDWKKRLGALIANADTVVFIVSPGSVGSEICRWEVDEAVRLSKRILPVLWIAPQEGQQVPERLAELNYTRFDEGRSFIAGLKALAAALNTDIGWLREHTRLLARALEWENANRVDNRMLTGADIAAAKDWAARRPPGAPELTMYHLDFIRASEAAETARKLAEDSRQKKIENLARYAAVELKWRYVRTINARRSSTGTYFGEPEELLAEAIDAYELLSNSTHTKHWAFINLVGLIRRAERDRVALRSCLNADEMAASIIDDLKDPSKERSWEYALLGEAWLGLGDIAKAQYWFQLYADNPFLDLSNVNAKRSLEGTRRQLMELWEIDETHPAASILDQVNKKAGGV